MNPHIKELAPFVWLVNFQYIKDGWIEELKPNDDFDPTASLIISDTGRYLVNSEDHNAKNLLPFLVMMPRLTKKQLHKRRGFYRVIRSMDSRLMGVSDMELEKRLGRIGVENDGVESLFNEICDWEVERRRKMKGERLWRHSKQV